MSATVKVKLLNHSYCRLVNQDDYEKVSKVLQYYKLSWVGRRKQIRYYKLVYKNSLKFQTGFIPYLRKHFSIDMLGNFPPCLRPKTDFPEVKGVKWFRDQVDIFKIVFHQRRSRGVIKAPTGSGKTLVAAGLIATYEPERCLFIVHTKDLLDQTYKEFNTLFKGKVGIIGDNKQEWNRITVGTIQTLSNLKLHDMDIQMVIVDEAHHSPSSSYRKVINQLTLAGVRYGLTATPRKDKEGKMWSRGLFGELIVDISSSELIKKGRLSVPKVVFHQVPFFASIAELRNYREVYNKGIVYNDTRNMLIAEVVKELKKKGSILILVKEVKHGEQLEKFGAGMLVQGSTKLEVRTKIKSMLESKDIKSVISTPVWGEGINVKSINSIIIAGGGLSEIKTIQNVGRGLRIDKGKKTVNIADFLDTTHYFLRRHSRERRKVYVNEGWEVGGVDEKYFDGRRIKK